MPWYKRTPPVGFQAHLKTNLLDEDLWDFAGQTGVHTTIDHILKGQEPDFSLGTTYERMIAKGFDLAESGQLLNHFQSLQE